MRSWRVSARPCSRWRCSPSRSAISALRQSEGRSRWAALSHLSERPVESSVLVRMRQNVAHPARRAMGGRLSTHAEVDPGDVRRAPDPGPELAEAHLHRSGLEPRVVFRSNDNATVQGLVAAGLGAAFVPLLAVDADDRAVNGSPPMYIRGSSASSGIEIGIDRRRASPSSSWHGKCAPRSRSRPPVRDSARGVGRTAGVLGPFRAERRHGFEGVGAELADDRGRRSRGVVRWRLETRPRRLTRAPP